MKKQFYLFISVISFFVGCLSSQSFLILNEPNQEENENIYKYVYNGPEEAQPSENDRLTIDFIDEETKTYYILTEM
nr:hypothetical protein [uncultured Flavobacterium sp.]